MITPGPWEFVKDPKDYEDEGGIRQVGSKNWICSFGYSTQYYPENGHPPDKEDLRLILAAPALLAVAEKILYGEDELSEATVAMLSAAVRQARGR